MRRSSVTDLAMVHECILTIMEPIRDEGTKILLGLLADVVENIARKEGVLEVFEHTIERQNELTKMMRELDTFKGPKTPEQEERELESLCAMYMVKRKLEERDGT